MTTVWAFLTVKPEKRASLSALKMQIKLDLYVNVYIAQPFYWMQSLKPHTALLVVCLLGQKNWVIT